MAIYMYNKLNKKINIKVLIMLVFVLVIIPKKVFAYTITFNSTFGEFSNGTKENIVEYDSNHNVINGTYEEPTYNNGIDSSDFITWYSEYDAKNRVNINEINENKTVYAAYEKVVWRFGYTGGEQSFALPIKVGLQLKVWGAQGGTIPGPLSINDGTATIDKMAGGFGGYSTGLFDFEENQNIYINVGGQGSLNKGRNTVSEGGYNGGGTGGVGNASHLTNARSTGGGGATHIATKSGILSSLEDSKNNIAIVAGGGGGKYYFRNDTWYSGPNLGHGGGFKGGYAYRWGTHANGRSWLENQLLGGSQTSAGNRGSFGQGGNKPDTGDYGEQGGGGGGYYGGGSATFSASGGSGYIGNNVENTRYMAIYSDPDVPQAPANQSKPSSLVSDEDSTKTIITTNSSEEPIEDYAKLGNGYAQAELTRLNIRYINEFDGTDFTKDQYVGSLAQEFSITQRPGYEAHWYKGNDIWNFDDPVNFDTTLEVKYTIITYNINYTLNDGTLLSSNPLTYTVESDDITLNNPEKDYYDFKGWTGTELSEKTMTVTIPKGSYGERTYIANYDLKEYEIEYDLDGGQASNKEKYTIETDDFTLNKPTKTGYTFRGWTGSNGDTKEENVTILKGTHTNLNYKANYDINQYHVIIKKDNDELINDDYDYMTSLDNPLNNLQIDDGYELNWYDETNTKVTFPYSVYKDTTITGKIEKIEYTIEYLSNNENANINLNNPTTYDVETNDIILNNPIDPDEYHYFVGWTTDLENETDLSKNYTIKTSDLENKKIYAIFQTSPYTVSFDSDGGNKFDPIKREGTENIGELPIPEKKNNKFLGWYVNDKKIDENFHSRIDVTAIAKWEELKNPITGDQIIKYVGILIVLIILVTVLIIIKKKTKKK